MLLLMGVTLAVHYLHTRCLAILQMAQMALANDIEKGTDENLKDIISTCKSTWSSMVSRKYHVRNHYISGHQ